MRILFTETEIASAVDRMAGEIAAELPADAVIAPILTGAFVFAADLARGLAKRGRLWELDFLHLSSYGSARQSSGEVRIVKDLSGDVRGKTVLLLDDVLDSGRSLTFAAALMRERGAADVKIAVMADKSAGRAMETKADFFGFQAPADAFLVGYGMDDGGFARGYPDIRVID